MTAYANVDPCEGCQFDGFLSLPGRSVMDQLGLVTAIDGFDQGIVLAVALAADRRRDAGFGQAFATANRQVPDELKPASQHLVTGRC